MRGAFFDTPNRITIPSPPINDMRPI